MRQAPTRAPRLQFSDSGPRDIEGHGVKSLTARGGAPWPQKVPFTVWGAVSWHWSSCSGLD